MGSPCGKKGRPGKTPANATTLHGYFHLAGLFVHGIARGSINYTLEWKTDMTFAGVINGDSDGDFKSDGATAGALISPAREVPQAFDFARTLRDACLMWPARVGPQLAAAFDVDAAAVTIYLEDQVRQLLTELASDRVEF